MSELREHITNTISVGHEALPDKDGVLLCACGSYFDDKAEHGAHVADAVIRELSNRCVSKDAILTEILSYADDHENRDLADSAEELVATAAEWDRWK